MPHSVTLITTLAAAFGLALILGLIAARLKLPALVGYLIAGVLIGPPPILKMATRPQFAHSAAAAAQRPATLNPV